tara:strand:+ start:118 stop:636 length:519 start_codon:yes stop_codon:yes gene_type:complete
MNKKNIKQKRTFVPQSIGDTLRKVNRKFSSKYNRTEFLIHSKWPEIVGKYFLNYSEPLNVSKVRDFENDLGETVYKNYLNVSVTPAAAIEFQHFKDTIIEKINTYFGYKAIIDLRIQQNYIPKNNTMKKAKSFQINKDDKEFIKKNIEKFQNNELKKSLLNLGNKITIKDKE